MHMHGSSETFAERWRRRALTIPVFLVLAVVFLALLPLLLFVTLVVDSFGRNRFAVTRATLAIALYLACEAVGVLAAGAIWVAFGGGRSSPRYLEANYRLQSLWARTLLGGAIRIFGMRVRVEGTAALASGPFLLFVRHASTVDTLLAANFVAPDEPYRLRYVIKRELLWDPCLDIVGQRIPNAFIRRGSGAAAREIEALRALARDLGPRDGVLIYPEGTRATPRKRAEALARIEAADPQRLARVASLRCVLPARYGGPLGLVEERPDVDVVFLAHAGFDGVHDLGELWRGILIGRELRIAFWRVAARDVPVARDERERWLDAEWRRVDDWIALHPAA
jgi:1-acyl-sn-glycerol-3-phosphate acyltransferase